MKRLIVRIIMPIGLVLFTALVIKHFAQNNVQKQGSLHNPVSIFIDYPLEGSIFPPEFPAPTWLWRAANDTTASWEITVTFSDGSASIRTQSAGERMRIGITDPRCVAPTNMPPSLTPEQASSHTWTPDSALWSTIKKHSVDKPATIVITGHYLGDSKKIFSRGQVSIRTSGDSVGAPIFYRDVPLMPSENEKGVIKPLAQHAVPLIAWRLRSVGQRESHVLMEGLHTCANCHSFSADGTTLGLDMDGPHNDKGLYAIVKTKPRMTIRNEDLVTWSTFRGKLGSKLRVGFMSQISPDARYVITSVNDPGIDQSDYERRKKPIDLIRNQYVANFKDYRFLQVFFPTRGILAWYSRESAHLKYLPGADDTNYVQTNAVWSPDGKYLVFARAPARDAYGAGWSPAQYANDPKETQIQYDLYRIPFNEGKGGKPEPIKGASQNGVSNSFPKISPDGRWIVFVKSRNGLLMRPDGQLFIVSASGGTARRMNCNTPVMNSWHSFSPNGRWMVFSSKSRSPYTQMFLTHIDESGDDSPAILIEDATAANRAVNIPEFVNISPDGMEKIETPAAEYALHMDLADASLKNHQFESAILELNKALEFDPKEPWIHNNLGMALIKLGKVDEAIEHYRKALTLNPLYSEAYNNLGEAMAGKSDNLNAIVQFENAVQLDSGYTVARANLGMVLARTGQTDKAIVQLKKVMEGMPDGADARRNFGQTLAKMGKFQEASIQLEKAVGLSGGRDPLALFFLGQVYADLGRVEDAIHTERDALSVATEQNNSNLIQAVREYLDVLVTKR